MRFHFSNSRSSCHILQEKIIVLLISTIIYNMYIYLRLKQKMDSLLFLIKDLRKASKAQREVNSKDNKLF